MAPNPVLTAPDKKSVDGQGERRCGRGGDVEKEYIAHFEVIN